MRLVGGSYEKRIVTAFYHKDGILISTFWIGQEGWVPGIGLSIDRKLFVEKKRGELECF